MLLGESTKYQGLYGLEALSSGEAGNVVSTMSEYRMTTFSEAYDQLQEKIQAKPKGISAFRKTRWAIRDREKFTALISDLSYFVSKLNELLPAQDGVSRAMMAQDFGVIPSTHDVKMIREAFSGYEAIVEAMAEQNLIERCQRRILQRIWFRAINDRHDDIAVPHSDTYVWVLQPSEERRKWDDLRAWMESGSGIYWLSGKAGSGKSTLLTYIRSHPATTQLLQTWAGNASLTKATFFFWNLGSHQQKSQEGLSRALLYEILDSNRNLIPQILPNMWREGYGNDKPIGLPSTTELRQAFERVALTITNGRKLFLLIDGLEEHEGNVNEGIILLKRLSSNPNIKALVSSRPIRPCFEAFSECQKLHLHDLTERDIKKYVDENLCVLPQMIAFQKSDPEYADKIIAQVVEKSSGVFLWVVLACRSLSEGLVADDSIADLQQRVDELPPELQNLFGHVLLKIERRYRGQAAKYLRIMHKAHSLPRTEKVQCLGLAFIEHHKMSFDRVMNIRRESLKENLKGCKMIERRLRSRCWGLLEVKAAAQITTVLAFALRARISTT